MPSTSGESKKVGRMQNRRKISRVLGSNSVVNEHKTGGGNRTGWFVSSNLLKKKNFSLLL